MSNIAWVIEMEGIFRIENLDALRIAAKKSGSVEDALG